MSLSTYFYDVLHEPFFTASDFNRFFDAAWDSRTPSPRRDLRHRQDPSLAATQDVVPRYAPLPCCSAAAECIRTRMDIHESKDKNEMTAVIELPGMRKEDVNIDVHSNRLVVTGQSMLSTTLDHEGYIIRERRVGRFSRALPLPVGTKVRTCARAVVGHGADVFSAAGRHQGQHG